MQRLQLKMSRAGKEAVWKRRCCSLRLAEGKSIPKGKMCSLPIPSQKNSCQQGKQSTEKLLRVRSGLRNTGLVRMLHTAGRRSPPYTAGMRLN